MREAVFLGADHTGAGSGLVWARPEHPDSRVLKGILVAAGITAAEMLRRSLLDAGSGQRHPIGDMAAATAVQPNRRTFVRASLAGMVRGVSDDWRTVTIDRLRSLILMAEPDTVEEAKWRKASNPDGVPTFSSAGLVCTIETYKDKVKLTFAKGASLNDPAGLFNASLDAGTRRAIDLHEGDVLDENAFLELVREAVARNRSGVG